MDRTELLKKVRRIEIRSKSVSNHIFAGEYHSAFKGKGMSFSEVREYSPGDDVKFIDWNVTARFNTPFVKVFEEERELTVMLLVDVSPSAFWGTVGMAKNELITEICAALAFSVINNNDKVGVLFFSNTIEKFIPPKKGRSHVLRIIHELLEFGYDLKPRPKQVVNINANDSADVKPAYWWQKLLGRQKSNPPPPAYCQTNLQVALQYFSNVIKKKCIAFVLSDFMCSNYEKALTIASQRHDLVGIQLFDLHEAALPNMGLVKVRDAETQQTYWLDSSDEKVQKQYAQHFGKRNEECRNAFSKAGADLICIPSNKPYIPYLMNFFKKRG